MLSLLATKRFQDNSRNIENPNKSVKIEDKLKIRNEVKWGLCCESFRN